jgi:hypothetical protein
MRTIGIGHDHGNTGTTDVVYLDGKERMITFPSASADGSLKRLAKARRASGNDSIVLDIQALERDEYVLIYDGVERFIGDLALTQGQVASTGRGDIHRYWSRRSLECLLVSAGTLIPDTSFELLVVTGLPVETFDETTCKQVKAALNGMHHFTLNGRERMAYVKVGKVLMEGAGASLLNGMEDTDDIHGVIDIGGYSTDLYVRQGLQAKSTLCRGFDVGVENAGDKISGWFEETYGYALTSQERTNILYASIGARNYPRIRANQSIIAESELAHWTQKYLREVGDMITERISKTWRTGETGRVAANFSQVDVIGGGAYYFINTIKEIIPFATGARDPEHANARGYGWFADTLVQHRTAAAS